MNTLYRISLLACALLASSICATSQSTSLVSVDSASTQANGYSWAASVSATGRYVAFESYATNLTAATDTNAAPDVFLRDRQAGTTTLVSVNTSGATGNGASSGPCISTDGRYVVFTSVASDLAGSSGHEDVFVRDLQTRTTSNITISANGDSRTLDNLGQTISADGRYVVFTSSATNLVSSPTDNNGVADVYLYDRQTSTFELESVNSSGALGDMT
jgi:Tol biopolymer transport system component